MASGSSDNFLQQYSQVQSYAEEVTKGIEKWLSCMSLNPLITPRNVQK